MKQSVMVGLATALVAAGLTSSVATAQAPLSSDSPEMASSVLAAKKKSAKGTLAVVVAGSGSYTVTGKGFRKSGTASKSFKVRPGVYRVKAPSGSVEPVKVKVRRGKKALVRVTFAAVPAPTPTATPSVAPVPSVTPTPTPTVSPTPTAPPRVPGAVLRVSTDATGAQANSFSYHPVWSPDGTRVAFYSYASNLVPGDNNGSQDVFVKTLAGGAIQRINTDKDGIEANRGSYDPVWSPDGTRVAFHSYASNLVPGDTNSTLDVFVKTLAGGAIQRISTDKDSIQVNGGSSGPVWSPDGTRIAFSSDASNLVPADSNTVPDLFVKTLVSGEIQRITTDKDDSQVNGASTGPVWSPDGTRIVFGSDASNLVPGDTNGAADVFVKTLVGGAIQRISTDAAGTQADGRSYFPVWSPDGAEIAFHSEASNLVPGDTNDDSDLFVKTLG